MVTVCVSSCTTLYRVLGTSGENIDDLFKYSEGSDRLALLEDTLLWNHITPTAPDTLSESVMLIFVNLPSTEMLLFVNNLLSLLFVNNLRDAAFCK